MTPLNWAARIVAAAAHEVMAEYRKLDPQPAAPPPAAEPAAAEINCTNAGLRDRWQPQQTAPAAARAVGFGPPGGLA